MKWEALFIIFKGLSLKQKKTNFLEGVSQTLTSALTYHSFVEEIIDPFHCSFLKVYVMKRVFSVNQKASYILL